MLKPITITRSQCRFFYRGGRYFCAVRIPYAPEIYMDMANDNRPFDMIFNDIQAAIALFSDSYTGEPYLREVSLAMTLPGLLGYKRSNARLI